MTYLAFYVIELHKYSENYSKVVEVVLCLLYFMFLHNILEVVFGFCFIEKLTLVSLNKRENFCKIRSQIPSEKPLFIQ